ncbi:hypothetical protein QBC38DRAFT_241271 [Podospora fimiseda]|uniref:Uncharacterized protein n=1 Tax=Podospora fimiseda TaxID=252190 RepID=A0AAN7BMK9_9PEZI|nr:hypothetical protein QBC38DRAFT_241271 [Podospora fimiseda]
MPPKRTIDEELAAITAKTAEMAEKAIETAMRGLEEKLKDKDPGEEPVNSEDALKEIYTIEMLDESTAEGAASKQKFFDESKRFLCLLVEVDPIPAGPLEATRAATTAQRNAVFHALNEANEKNYTAPPLGKSGIVRINKHWVAALPIISILPECTYSCLSKEKENIIYFNPAGFRAILMLNSMLLAMVHGLWEAQTDSIKFEREKTESVATNKVFRERTQQITDWIHRDREIIRKKKHGDSQLKKPKVF